MTKQFFKYVVPSMVAFALSGVYAIVDGFFVGNSIGDIGLAAINVAYPLQALVQALATAIGMGGAVLYSIYHGAKRYQERNRYFWISFYLLLIATLVMMGVAIPMITPIMKLFGASGVLLEYSQEYLFYVLLGTVFPMFGVGLVPFIRNMGGAFWSTGAMVGGFVTNIVLDYIFVWKLGLGMKGAAFATVLGQAVTIVVCAIFIFQRRKDLTVVWNADWKYQLLKIIKVGISPFGITFAPNVTLILINKSALLVGGDLAVSEYAVIAYIVCVVGLLLQGICDGCQPLMSLCHGKEDYEGAHHVRNLCYSFSFLTALVCAFLMYQYRFEITSIFGASSEVIMLVGKDIGVFLVGFLFVAFSRTTMSYFYATQKNVDAYALIYGEPISLWLFLFILPQIYGIQGTWISVPLSQALICILSLVLLIYNKKKYQM